MKKSYLIILLVLFTLNSFSQSIDVINSEINTLNIKKRSAQANIKKYQKELKEINAEIKILEQKKSTLTTSSSGGTVTATVNSLEGILRDKPSSMGKELARIKEGEKITVYREHEGLYLKISYIGKTGYLNYSSISSNPEIDKILSSNTTQKQNTSTTTVRSVDFNDPKYKRLAKIYGKEKAVKLMNGELWKGMSHGMVLESLGKPTSKSNTNTLDGLMETWQYSNKKVIFLNGEVSEWK